MGRFVKYFLSFIILLSFTGGVFISCTNNTVDKKIVTVTILPQKYFAEKIAGDKFEINCIVPLGSNPEAYDPSPSHLVHLGKSVAYFKIGYIGFEMAWLDKLLQNNPGMKLYDTSKGVNFLSGTHACSDESVHMHIDSVDPHIWSSPKNAFIIARNMYAAFVELDPQNKSYYRKNYEKLVDEIHRVDQELTSKLSPSKGEMFAIYHPSLSYLARDYQLRQLSIELNGKEPSALYMKEAIDMARKNDVKVIFIQREFDVKQAQVFAKELNCEVFSINPLNYNWSNELMNIADAIAKK